MKAMPKFAFSIPTSDDAEQRRLFAGFRPSGFDGLQLKGGQYARYLSEPARFLAEWESNAGLIYGGGLDPDGVAALRRVLKFAAAIQAEKLIFCHSLPRAGVTETDIRQFAHQLSDLGEEAAAQGVTLSLHHHYDQPVMHRSDMELFFSAAKSGAVGLTLDTAHLIKSGIADIAGVVQDFGAVLDNVHLKDFSDGQFQTLGNGEIAFEPVFAALHCLDYQGWLCADEESGVGVEASLGASFEFLRRGWQNTEEN